MDGEQIAWSVADTGIGVPPDMIEKIFEPFEQGRRNERLTPRKGTGLGLAIGRRLARVMGGSLTVDTQEGKGSTFVLRMPLKVGVPRTSSAAAAVAVRLSARPRSPVQALAWPELVSTARARPPLAASRSAQRSTQAARTSEVVKVPAHTAPSGASSSERSGLPEGLRPAVMPAARKPTGAVTPPGIGCQGWVTGARRLPLPF